MKTELASAIGAAIAGLLIAFFVTNLFLGDIEDVSVKTVTGDISADLSEPSQEVFNYKSINPTVEVYVGDCTTDGSSEECIIDGAVQSPEESANGGESQENQ